MCTHEIVLLLRRHRTTLITLNNNYSCTHVVCFKVEKDDAELKRMKEKKKLTKNHIHIQDNENQIIGTKRKGSEEERQMTW